MGKAKHKVTNWSKYNKALVNRGSITFWVDDAAMDSWYSHKHHGGRGRSNSFTDSAIETALMIKGAFGLLLRSLEEFLNSIFKLMDAPLISPTYSCISKRAKTVEIKYRNPSRGAIAHIAIDSTGLKVFGDGE